MPVPPVYAKVIPVPNALDIGDETVPSVGATLVKVRVVVIDADKKFVSEAFETDSEHVPNARAVTRPEVSEQFADPCVTDIDMLPVPPPPLIATMIPVTRSPDVVATDNAGCAMRSIVMVVAAEERESNTLSASRVATTLQVPAELNVSCVPFTTHDAEPVSDTANDKIPEPDPPDVAKAIGVP